MGNELRYMAVQLSHQRLLVRHRPVANDAHHEEVAVVREGERRHLPLDALHELVSLSLCAKAVARLQHARRVVLLQHLHHRVLEGVEDAVDELLAFLRRCLLRPKPLPRVQARLHSFLVRPRVRLAVRHLSLLLRCFVGICRACSSACLERMFASRWGFLRSLLGLLTIRSQLHSRIRLEDGCASTLGSLLSFGCRLCFICPL
mmetsp:Transcript_16813/g.36119  ORF Transcript_16813/g.36119 Transcript_16813/m.36119 type:complete len:203 (-) Transcript_16813:311-919(-)